VVKTNVVIVSPLQEKNCI